MRGQEALLEHRSLLSHKKLLDNRFKQIRIVPQNYISPKQMSTMAENLFTNQDVDECADDFVARIREEAY